MFSIASRQAFKGVQRVGVLNSRSISQVAAAAGASNDNTFQVAFLGMFIILTLMVQVNNIWEWDMVC